MLALLLVPAALANGLTTHVWISMEARALLPDGPLAELVNDPALEEALRNGTQFPDGGYAVDHPYGEAAHWEPLQGLYLDWIRATYGSPPYEGEARQHVAFLLGLGAHGISDQTHDSMFLTRAAVYDAASDWSGFSADEATDVALAAAGGAQPVPEVWVPTDALPSLFAELGIEVDAGTLERGQALTCVAVAYVGAVGENPEAVAMYHDRFPWASEHILDAEVPGSAPMEAVVTALYWQELWARLEGSWTFDDPLMISVPGEGDLGHPTDSGSVESRVSFVLTRGLNVESLLPGMVTVTDATGKVYVPEPQLYYGQNSQAVNLLPNEDWAADEDFVVTVGPGLSTIGGDASTEPFSFTFSTRAPLPEDTGGRDTGELVTQPACGCASGGPVSPVGALLALLALRRRRAVA